MASLNWSPSSQNHHPFSCLCTEEPQIQFLLYQLRHTQPFPHNFCVFLNLSEFMSMWKVQEYPWCSGCFIVWLPCSLCSVSFPVIPVLWLASFGIAEHWDGVFMELFLESCSWVVVLSTKSIFPHVELGRFFLTCVALHLWQWILPAILLSSNSGLLRFLIIDSHHYISNNLQTLSSCVTPVPVFNRIPWGSPLMTLFHSKNWQTAQYSNCFLTFDQIFFSVCEVTFFF